MADDDYTMADVWAGHRQAVQKHRAEMLTKADVTGWTKHTDYHFSRYFNGVRVNWWPSGGKLQIGNRMVYGHRNVRAALNKLLGAQQP